MNDSDERDGRGPDFPPATPEEGWEIPPPPNDKTEVVPAERVEQLEKALQAGRLPRLTAGMLVEGFRLQRQLGSGGAGVVFLAESLSDGSPVAIKFIRPEHAHNAAALRRFKKEARLMATIASPFVVALERSGEFEGHHFVVSEFIDGVDLATLRDRYPAIGEREALFIVACVLRGLNVIHELDIVHRDIKPANILVVVADPVGDGPLRIGDIKEVKIADLGIARQVDQSESLAMTQMATTLGTPMFMAPEQFQGGGRKPDVRSDLYATGATLFWMLAGRGPFDGEDAFELAEKHKYETPPALADLVAEISPAVDSFVARLLAKAPADRIASAALALEEVERILHGAPGSPASHPALPEHNADSLMTYRFEWELRSSPEQLWPLVSHTDRVNQAIGLPAPKYRPAPPDVAPFSNRAEVRVAGIPMRWMERPFEWIEARRFSVLREFDSGPFKWFVTNVELRARADGGSTLVQTFVVEPRHRLGRTLAKFQIGVASRRSLSRLYHNLDAVLQAESGGVGPLNEGTSYGIKPSSRARGQLKEKIQRLVAEGVASRLALALEDYLQRALDSNVTAIRPLALARLFGHDERETLEACLRSIRAGILEMRWDLICPVCRVASTSVQSLAEVKDHSDCPACRTRFPIDLAQGVELVFSIAPDIRSVTPRKYCAGGPYHLPHVLAQIRVAASEQFDLALDLPPGDYQVTGPQLAKVQPFVVAPGGSEAELTVDLSQSLTPERTPVLGNGPQTLSLRNYSEFELVVRVERLARRSDCLTAATVSTMALFKQLCPEQLISGNVLGRMAHGIVIAVRLVSMAGQPSRSPEPGGFDDLVRCHAFFEDQYLASGFAITQVRSDSLTLIGQSMGKAYGLIRDFYSDLSESGPRIAVGFVVHEGSIHQANVGGHTVCQGESIAFVEAHLPRASAGEIVFSSPAWDRWTACLGSREEQSTTPSPTLLKQQMGSAPDGNEAVVRWPMDFSK